MKRAMKFLRITIILEKDNFASIKLFALLTAIELVSSAKFYKWQGIN